MTDDVKEVVPKSTSPDDVLEFVQQRRLSILSGDLDLKEETAILKDLGSTAIQQIQNGIMGDAVGNIGEIAHAMISRYAEDRKNPFEREITGEVIESHTPTLEDDIHFDISPDELSVEQANIDYDDLFQSTED